MYPYNRLLFYSTGPRASKQMKVLSLDLFFLLFLSRRRVLCLPTRPLQPKTAATARRENLGSNKETRQLLTKRHLPDLPNCHVTQRIVAALYSSIFNALININS